MYESKIGNAQPNFYVRKDVDNIVLKPYIFIS